MADSSLPANHQLLYTSAPSCKDLGIYFSDNLSWRLHLQNITSKAYKSFGLLHRIFKDAYSLLLFFTAA